MTKVRDIWNMLQEIEKATGARASLGISTRLDDLMPPSMLVSVQGLAAGSKTRIFAEQAVSVELMSEGDHVLRRVAGVISEIWNREEEKTLKALRMPARSSGGYQPDCHTKLNPDPPQDGSGVPKKGGHNVDRTEH